MNWPHEEPHVVAALAEAIGRADCIVDVGCGDGYELLQFDAARRIGFDPHPDVVPLAGFDFRRVAIGAFNGTATLWDGPAPGCSSTLDRGGRSWLVEMRQLDSLGLRPDILIIDTEGTTLDVLRGARESLATIRLVYAEVQMADLDHCQRNYEAVDACLRHRGFVERHGLPAYDAGVQANRMWVRP